MRHQNVLRSPGAALAVAATVAWGMAASCRTVSPRGVPGPPKAPSTTTALLPKGPVPVAEYVPAPQLRIGILTDVPRVSIGADAGVVVWGASAEGSPAAVPTRLARASFLPVAAPGGPRFRVQVASLGDEAGARLLAGKVESTVGLAPTVRRAPESGAWQVRVGEFAGRDEARDLAGRLGRRGLPGSFVIDDTASGLGRLRLVETGEEFEAAVAFPAHREDMLAADAAVYRGLLEVRAGEPGTLTVVNIVNIEDYLRGVVPNELAPQAFPQIEALKAQAVAARSYALSHRDDYAARGYDLCATAACQVYRGRGTEYPLTDRAVEETAGIVAAYRGRPINAFYTSTCGGHTEDAENMFESDAAPYLKGVACAPERSAWAAIRTTSSPRGLPEEPGLARAVALLQAVGVLEAKPAPGPWLKGIPADADLRGWTTRLLEALKRKGCEPGVGGALARRGNFTQFVVGSLCWEERGRRLLNADDPDYLLRVEDRAELAGNEKIATALLVSEGVLSPFPDNTIRAGTAISRAEAILLLAGVAERAGVPGLVSAEFAGAAGGQLTVMIGETAESYPLDPAARLFRNLEGTRAAASELALAIGDRVDFVVRDGSVVYLEAAQSRHGVAADRTSRYYRWEVRLTPAEVGRAIGRYGTVAAVRDVEPRRLGVSGRVIDLAVMGDGEELVLKGLKVRWGLGLRENLFVVERELDGKGQVRRFVFTGKGWGHGVGLCQVGAFGMAQAGATYEQILRHYYTGIELKRAY